MCKRLASRIFFLNLGEHMKDHRNIVFSLLVVCLALMSVTVSFAQPEAKEMQVEPSFDVALNLVIGSNENVAGTAVPAELNGVSKQIRSNFGFSNYRLASTFIGRLANNGNFDYKSTSNVFGQDTQAQFLDWSITSLRSMPTAKGTQGFQARAFRFGARVPVTTSMAGEGGKMTSYTNYESIGLGLVQLGLTDNVPTLIGTLNLPGAGGTVFLVMTVRSAN